MLTESLAADSTRPPNCVVGDTRPSPKFDNPCEATVARPVFVEFGRALTVPALLKLKPTLLLVTEPRSYSSESCRPSSTPISYKLFNWTSANNTWIITIGGR